MPESEDSLPRRSNRQLAEICGWNWLVSGCFGQCSPPDKNVGTVDKSVKS